MLEVQYHHPNSQVALNKKKLKMNIDKKNSVKNIVTKLQTYEKVYELNNFLIKNTNCCYITDFTLISDKKFSI